MRRPILAARFRWSRSWMGSNLNSIPALNAKSPSQSLKMRKLTWRLASLPFHSKLVCWRTVRKSSKLRGCTWSTLLIISEEKTQYVLYAIRNSLLWVLLKDTMYDVLKVKIASNHQLKDPLLNIPSLANLRPIEMISQCMYPQIEIKLWVNLMLDCPPFHSLVGNLINQTHRMKPISTSH